MKITLDQLNANDEFSTIFPPLPEYENSVLTESILDIGVLNPAIILKGTTLILDGHNRVRICQEHNIPCPIEEMEFADINEAKMWMIRNQIGRRNVNAFVKCEMIMELEPAYRKEAEQRMYAGKKADERNPSKTFYQGQGKTADTLAEIIGLSGVTYRKAKWLIDNAAERTKEDLRKGILSIHQAYTETRRILEDDDEELRNKVFSGEVTIQEIVEERKAQERLRKEADQEEEDVEKDELELEDEELDLEEGDDEDEDETDYNDTDDVDDTDDRPSNTVSLHEWAAAHHRTIGNTDCTEQKTHKSEQRRDEQPSNIVSFQDWVAKHKQGNGGGAFSQASQAAGFSQGRGPAQATGFSQAGGNSLMGSATRSNGAPRASTASKQSGSNIIPFPGKWQQSGQGGQGGQSNQPKQSNWHIDDYVDQPDDYQSGDENYVWHDPDEIPLEQRHINLGPLTGPRSTSTIDDDDEDVGPFDFPDFDNWEEVLIRRVDNFTDYVRDMLSKLSTIEVPKNAPKRITAILEECTTKIGRKFEEVFCNEED